MTTHERDGGCNSGNGKYLSWGFIRKLGIVLGALLTAITLLGTVYIWIDAKIETKMDRGLLMEMMDQQTKSLQDMSDRQSASLKQMTDSQKEMSAQLHNVDKRLVRIETKLEK